MPRKRRRRSKKKGRTPEQQVDEIVSHRFKRRLKELADEAEAGFKNLSKIRAEHASCIGYYAGSHHPSGEHAQRRPLNNFQRAVSAYMSHLAGAEPEAEITPINAPETDILSRVLAARVTACLRKIGYRRSKQLMVVDALCGFQVGRVGLIGEEHCYDFDGEFVRGTKPNFMRIAPPDYVVDPAASSRHNMRFEGHRFRIGADRVEMLPGLTQDQIDSLSKWSQRTDNYDSESRGVGSSGRSDADAGDFWHDLIDLHVRAGYLSKEPLIVTLTGTRESPDLLTARKGGNEPIPVRVMEYEGHESGPYVYQDIHPIPDSVIGSSPAPGWKQLDVMCNMLARHIVDSESRRKKGMVFKGTEGRTLVNAILDSPDQFVIEGDPTNVGPYEVGGSSPTAWNSLAGMSELFSRTSGNSDQLSGQGPQRRGGDTTATEVASVERALTVMLDAMESQMGEFDDEVTRRLAWYDLNDPLLDEVVTIMNMGVPVPITLSPEIAQEQIIEQYHYRVRLGSMRRKDRGQIAAERRQGVAVVAAALQMEQMSQGRIKAKKWAIQSFGDLYTQAEIDQWWADDDIKEQAAMVAGDPGRKKESGGYGGGPSLSTVGGMQSNVGSLGALFTGAQSPNFNQSALPGQTLAGMGI